MASDRSRLWILCAGLFLGTVLLYAPTAWYGFIGYDDPLYVENAHAREGLSFANVLWAFTLGPERAGNYHPVTWLSHMLDFSLAGARPGFHHAHNALLHATAAVTLLLVLYRATGALWASAAIAALFAWHPLHVQSVAWVAERKDVLSGLLFFLTLAAYVHYARRQTVGWYLSLLVLAAAALLAKPMLVTLPFVLLLLDYWPLRRQERWPRLIVEKLPLVAMAIAMSVLTVLAQGKSGAIRTTENLPLVVRLANVPVSCVRYLYLTAWPLDLAIFYPYRAWSAATVAASMALLLIITGLALWQRRRRPYLIVGWLIFLGMLLPVIGIVQVGEQSIADRYTYLPLIGIFIMLVFLMAEWRQDVFNSCVAVVLVGSFVIAAWQVRFWQSDLVLFGRALAVTENNYIAHGYVGKALAARRDNDAALAHYDQAIALKPGYWEVHYNRGNLLLRAGRLDEAIASYRRAVEIKDDHADAWNNLGIALATQEKLVEAEQSLARASAAAPDRADITANLARVRARLSRSN